MTYLFEDLFVKRKIEYLKWIFVGMNLDKNEFLIEHIDKIESKLGRL